MSTRLSALSVGSTVYMNVNGTRTAFLVVHQGTPTSSSSSVTYDASCDGTWLLMKDIYETRAWGSSNHYSASTIHSYLNGTFLGLLDTDIQNAIQQVRIPYVYGTGFSGTVETGSSGLSTKIFLLSGYEVGFTTAVDSNFPRDGILLDYFTTGTGTSANNLRRAYLGSSYTRWWLRSPDSSNTYTTWAVSSSGSNTGESPGSTLGVRPAMVLDDTLWADDNGDVTDNVAPTTPSSITIPTSISGGSTITISWGSSTDDDGNLAGYIVERSTDGGSTWTQIYQGTLTTTTDTVAYGTSTVMYRVKAYDTAGEESSYRTSSQVTVINNTAPTAPSSISVPTEVNGGGTITISWGSSTDADNNLSGYILERNVDSGGWEQVYKGDALSYTDTITKGWSTVAYRVKAYDAYDAESGYTTSATRTVNNNTAPVITCAYESGSDLGTKTSGFSISYSVDDADEADSVTVTEKLDGVTKRSYTATKGSSNSFAVTGDYFMKVLNGSHVLTIEATDGTETTVYTLSFTKMVTKATITLETPMEADDKISLCAITVAGSIPTDAVYTIEVTNNGKDDVPVWEDCTIESKNGVNYVFTNETATNGYAFNFRVTAERGASDTGGYITSIQGGFQ